MNLEDIVSEMIINDHNEAKKEIILNKQGYPSTNSLETIPQIMNDK